MEMNATFNSSQPCDLTRTGSDQYIMHWFLVTFSVFLIGFAYAKWKDSQASKTARCIVLPMQSIFQSNTWYEILLYTMNSPGSGTTANVFMRMHCSKGSSGVFQLTDVINHGRTLFHSGSVACFLVALPTCIGIPVGMHIWHDNSGSEPCWLLEAVLVKNTKSKQMIRFRVNQWLSLLRSNTRLFVHLHSATDEEAANLQPNNSERVDKSWMNILRLCICNSHLWLSFFTSSELSAYSKQQRLASMLLSFLSMSVILVLMHNEPSCAENVLISLDIMYISLVASAIAFLPSTLLGVLFECTYHDESGKKWTRRKRRSLNRPSSVLNRARRSSMYRNSARDLANSSLSADNCKTDKNLSSESISNHSKLSSSGDYGVINKPVCCVENIENINRLLEQNKNRKNAESMKKQKLVTIKEDRICEFETKQGPAPLMPRQLKQLEKSSSYLPKECIYVEWMFFVVACCVLAYFIWLKSLRWQRGDFKTWGISVFLALLFDMAFLQFLRPIFQCLWIRRSCDKSTVDILRILTFHRNFWRGVGNVWVAANSAENRLLYFEALKNMVIAMPIHVEYQRQQLQVALTAKKTLKASPLYTLLFVSSVIVVLGSRDPSAFIVKEEIRKVIFMPYFHGSVDTFPMLLHWCESVLIPSICTSEAFGAFNSSRHAVAGIGGQWHLLQGIRITQKRIKDDECSIPAEMKPFISHCSGILDDENEETASYDAGWQQLESSDTNTSTTAWQYQPADMNKKWYHVLAWWSYAHHGGYVAHLGPSYEIAKDELNLLRKLMWVDSQSREVYIDFVLYNAEKDLAVLVHIKTTVTSVGDLEKDSRIHAIMLQRTYDINSYALLISLSISMVFAGALFVKITWNLLLCQWNRILNAATLNYVIIIICVTANTVIFSLKETLLKHSSRISNPTELSSALHQILCYDEYLPHILSAVCLALSVRMISIVSSIEIMQQFLLALKSAIIKIIHISSMPFLTTVSLASYGYLILYDSYDFSSFTKAVMSVISIATSNNHRFRDLYEQFPSVMLFISSASLIALYFTYSLSFIVINSNYKQHSQQKRKLKDEYLAIKNRIASLYANVASVDDLKERFQRSSVMTVTSKQITGKGAKYHLVEKTGLTYDKREEMIRSGVLQSLIESCNELYVDKFCYELSLLEAFCRLTQLRRAQWMSPVQLVVIKTRKHSNVSKPLHEHEQPILPSKGKGRTLNPVKHRSKKLQHLKLPSLKRNVKKSGLAMSDDGGPKHRHVTDSSLHDIKSPHMHLKLSKILLPHHGRKTKIERIDIHNPNLSDDEIMSDSSRTSSFLEQGPMNLIGCISDHPERTHLKDGTDKPFRSFTPENSSVGSPDTDCWLPSAVNCSPVTIPKSGYVSDNEIV